MSEHDQIRDAAGPWVLGALDEEEAWRFSAHLEVCATCRDEVERLQMAAEALPLAAPPIDPPPELKDRLMKIVEAEAAERRGAEGVDAPTGTPRATRTPRWRAWLEGFSARPALAAGAAALLLVAGGVIGFAAGGGDDSSTSTVAAEVQAAKLGQAKAELIQSGGQTTLRVSDMPPPAAGHVYQVWVQRDGGMPEPDAVFTVDREGRGSVGVIGDVDGADAVLVTRERSGGATTPSEAPVISVQPA